MKKLLLSIMLLSTPMWAQATVMESVRCGTDLVGVGDTKYEVEKQCGQPTSVEGNTWIYDRGPASFLIIIKFGNERVISIDEQKQMD